jgi:AcrR family transcriptional regulator
MARVVKLHDERRNELLDAAEELFNQNGYDSTSVANIIDRVGIAKGTFYHYFKSKADLLDQIINRQTEILLEKIKPSLDHSDMNAIEKFNHLCVISGQYEAEHKEVLMMLMRVLHSDENIILRDKTRKIRLKAFAPVLASVISQGVSEGVFDTGPPDHVAEMILQIGTHLSDECARMLVHEEPNSESQRALLEKCQTYENAVERILGAPEGSLHIVNKASIDCFFEE